MVVWNLFQPLIVAIASFDYLLQWLADRDQLKLLFAFSGASSKTRNGTYCPDDNSFHCSRIKFLPPYKKASDLSLWQYPVDTIEMFYSSSLSMLISVVHLKKKTTNSFILLSIYNRLPISSNFKLPIVFNMLISDTLYFCYLFVKGEGKFLPLCLIN
jgi:hypothetical protein